MRLRHLSSKTYKKKADKLFKKLCVEDGVPKVSAQAYYLGLKVGGKPATNPRNMKKVYRAPKKKSNAASNPTALRNSAK